MKRPSRMVGCTNDASRTFNVGQVYKDFEIAVIFVP